MSAPDNGSADAKDDPSHECSPRFDLNLEAVHSMLWIIGRATHVPSALHGDDGPYAPAGEREVRGMRESASIVRAHFNAEMI